MNKADDIKVVIFDFDGVLIESQEYLLPFFILQTVLTRKELIGQLAKKNLYLQGDWIKELSRNGINSRGKIKRISELMFEHYKDKIKIFDWTYKVIPELAKIKKLAILSNNSWQSIKYYLGDLKDFFCCIKTYEFLQELKPSPEGAKLVCEKLKIQPAQSFIVGDSADDILAAKAINALSGLVNWNGCEKVQQELVKLKQMNLTPDFYFTSHKQLIPYFNGTIK